MDYISPTQNWINKVVIGLNFCPFAAREVKRGSIHYEVLVGASRPAAIKALAQLFWRMGKEEQIETALLILPLSFSSFSAYLQLLDQANDFIQKQGYTGVYQLASFHPDYVFEGSAPDDAANYTNRSPYPMLHLLREKSLSQALAHYPEPEKIPQRNIDLARSQGLAAMRVLRDSCW